MTERSARFRDHAPICPDCGGDVTFVASWTFRGLWGYSEVQTYECPAHGPLFVNAAGSIEPRPTHRCGPGPDDGDRDSPILAPRRRPPTSKSDAVAVPEPDSD